MLEYDSQSNDNTDFLAEEDKYKFVDDLSVLEILNLIITGLSSYNFKYHVASDIGIDQLFLPSENIKSQSYTDNICEWTNLNKMKLNESKTKVMVINYTRNFQFATRIHLNGTLLETIQETSLLGTVFSSDLKWHANSDQLVRKGYQRMTILRKLYDFNLPLEDLVTIYNSYIRSILEYNLNVWFSSISNEERENIERVQRVACKIILKDDYINYKDALDRLNIQNLSDRRQMLACRFANKCVKSDRFKGLFPVNDNRSADKYVVKFAHTDRLKDSSIPAMQRILNKEVKK